MQNLERARRSLPDRIKREKNQVEYQENPFLAGNSEAVRFSRSAVGIPVPPNSNRGVGSILLLQEGWFGQAKRSSPIMAHLPWKKGINTLCDTSHLWAYSVFLDKCRQRAFAGIAKTGRVS